jgi:hypothetical protein
MRLPRLLKVKAFVNSNNNIGAKNGINKYYITGDDYRLIEDINNAKNEWLEADTNFQYVCENEIVDYYTYILKAAQIKYEYYLKKAKERGVRSKIDYKI